MDANEQATRNRVSKHVDVSPLTQPEKPVGKDRLEQRNSAAPRRIALMSRWRAMPSHVLMGAAGALILAAGVGLAMFAKSETPVEISRPSRILAVRTIPVRPVTSYEVAREYTGMIVARRTSQLGFEQAGKLMELHVSEGDSVTAGMALAQLDTERLETSRRRIVAQRAQAAARLDELVTGPRDEYISAARARVESLRAEVTLLKLQTVRRAKLVASNTITQEEYELHAFAFEAREAKLNEARHQLEELLNGTRKEQIEAQRAVVAELDAAIANIDVDLRKSNLTAPFDGTIARRFVDEGAVVEAGEPIFRLVEDQVLEAWIGLPSQATGRLIEGSSQRLKIHGEHFNATVSGRFPEVDPATRTRTVVLRLNAMAGGRVVHGQVVRLELKETVETDGFWLPSMSLTKGSRGLWTVLVVEGEAGASDATQADSLRVARRDVEVLSTQSDRVLVRGTLNPGDLVISGGTHRVVPGQRVRLASDATLSHLP